MWAKQEGAQIVNQTVGGKEKAAGLAIKKQGRRKNQAIVATKARREW